MLRKSPLNAGLLALIFSAVSLLLLLAALGNSAVAGPGEIAITPTVAPSATPITDPFSATLSISTGQSIVELGEELLVTVELDVIEGCRYPIVDITLFQSGADDPLFLHIDPPTSILKYPGPLPVTYRLRAIRTGEVNLLAQSFGERYCDDFWNWHYLSSNRLPVTVQGGLYQFYLPLLHAE